MNDGICDCCDASDEYFSNTKCENNCLELGSADRMKEKQRAELMKRGNQIRLDLSQRGRKQKEEHKIRMADLEKSRDQADKVREEKKAFKLDAESLENDALDVYRKIEEENKRQKEEAEADANRIEAEETFLKFDSNKDGKIEIAELQTRISFDKNRNGFVEVEEAKYFLDENDELELESFVSLAWPKIKPFLMLDAGLFKPPRKDGEPNDDDDDENASHREEPKEDDGDDAELLNEEDENHDDEEMEEEEAHEHTETSTPPAVSYDEETQQLIHAANEARNQYNEADRSYREIDTELTNIRSALEKDFGPDEEFAPLNNECFNYEDREYIYKLCMFDKATQQPRSGGMETR